MEEQLWNGMRLRHEGFPLGTDSVLLAHFLTLPPRARVVDFGSGCGTLGLLLCARDAACCVTGVELDEQAHRLAEQNSIKNNLSARLRPLLGDVRQFRTLLPAGAFDCAIANPPYFPCGSGKQSSRALQARSELTLTLNELCEAAAWALPDGGRFALVHRPERLCDLLCSLRAHRLEPKRLRLVRHRAEAEACLVLLEARKGGKPGLQLARDFIEFLPDGTPTEEYRAVYHEGDRL